MVGLVLESESKLAYDLVKVAVLGTCDLFAGAVLGTCDSLSSGKFSSKAVVRSKLQTGQVGDTKGDRVTVLATQESLC